MRHSIEQLQKLDHLNEKLFKYEHDRKLWEGENGPKNYSVNVFFVIVFVVNAIGRRRIFARVVVVGNVITDGRGFVALRRVDRLPARGIGLVVDGDFDVARPSTMPSAKLAARPTLFDSRRWRIIDVGRVAGIYFKPRRCVYRPGTTSEIPGS